MQLKPHQLDALRKIKNGCILCGGVGSGKSITSLAYYYMQNGGDISTLKGGDYIYMKKPRDLYIITTARKRDTLEWNGELTRFLLYPDPDVNVYDNRVIIDSWNNIQKYRKVFGAFFIFDEQRVVGSGAWVKAFLDITRKNQWILLSATPGDRWSDYIPVFIANGFYKNKTQFIDEHVIYSRFTKYPKIDRYINTGKLLRLRREILVDMPYERDTERHHHDIFVDYDVALYKESTKDRWNPYLNEPMKNASSLCYVQRRIVNSDISRQKALIDILKKHPKLIVFYNFDYELDILRKTLSDNKVKFSEWNGHNHEKIPSGKKWVYLVQYSAGAEGWNCITTDTIVFYSQNYSYRILEQSCGRIDRMNTPYRDLYYYHFKSRSSIDIGIARAIRDKRNFNERDYIYGG